MALVLPLDTSSPAQLAQAIAALPVTEAIGWIESLKRRAPSIDWARAVAASCDAGSPMARALRAGQLFQIGMLQAAVAAQLSQALLFNPVSSGLRFLVYEVAAKPQGGVSEVTLFLGVPDVPAFVGSNGVNLKSDGPSSKATVRIGSNAAAQNGAAPVTDRRSVGNGTNIYIGPSFSYNGNGESPCYELAPGTGILLVDGNVNDALWATFRWAEVPLNAAV